LLRRLLDSPATYFIAAGVLAMVGLFVTLFDLHVPSRPRGSVDDFARLRERDDTNVLFILIDTLRADRLSSYGYARPTSPVMDDVARAGVRFARVEAQSSWTKSSMASMLTGMYPTRSLVTRFLHAIPAEAELPAERLRAAGFRTAGIWRNGWVGTNFGFGQGYEAYFKAQAPGKGGAPRVQRGHPGQNPLAGSDEELTLSALEFIATHGHERFFLYVHFMDVHQYAYDDVAGALGFGTGHSDSYDASIHWVDRNIGALLLDLERRDLFKKTIVVVASDHGEGFPGEHGVEGHARTLYREVTDVPLILGLPFRLKEGIVVEPLVRNVDIWPTLYDLLGMPPIPDADGRSLVPMIEAAGRGQQPDPGDGVSLSFLDVNWGQTDLPPDPLVAVRKNGKRMLLRLSKPGDTMLFDHDQDPGEQNNLWKEQPAWAAELRELAQQQLTAKPAWESVPEVQIDDMYVDQLRALGYVIN
jgi:arylsulfatase A-like enzyme